MKKLLLASGLAFVVLGLAGSASRADCHNLSGCWHIKWCATARIRYWCEPFCCTPPKCCSGGCGAPACGPACGSCGGGGYGGGCSSCAGGCCGFGNCPPYFPGPWYNFWPYDGYSQISAPAPYWTYDQHFQTPAPTGYPNYPNPMVMANYGPACPSCPYPAAISPVGYAPHYGPNYWYSW